MVVKFDARFDAQPSYVIACNDAILNIEGPAL